MQHSRALRLALGVLAVLGGTLGFFAAYAHTSVDSLLPMRPVRCNTTEMPPFPHMYSRGADCPSTSVRMVFVVALESSGSKLVARLAHLLFTQQDDGWTGNGEAYNCVVVVHRSLPHGECFVAPDFIRSNLKLFDLTLSQARLIVVTRDLSVIMYSKMSTHQWHAATARKEIELGHAQLSSLLTNATIQTKVFSYESYMMLGAAYLAKWCEFLGLAHGCARAEAIPRSFLPKDANSKYFMISRRSLFEAMRLCGHRLLAAVGFKHRSPAFTIVAPTPSR